MRRALVLVLWVACGDSPAPPPPAIDAPVDAPPIPARLVLYAAGNGPDIGWFTISSAGVIDPVASVPTFAANPSFVAVAPNGKFAYAIAESADRIGAYRIDPADGALTFINDVDVGGAGPAHVAVDRTSTLVFAANYGDGSISVFPIDSDGRINTATQTITAGANAHEIVVDPANKNVFVPCLGSDYVAQYVLAGGMLTANAVPHLMTAAGAGPRHLAFAPDGTHAFLINELDSTLTALSYDATAGRLTALGTKSTLEAPVAGNSGAEVAVHPSGNFVYASNRGDNSIATFGFDGSTVTALAWTKTGGTTPRHFSLSPDGGLLVVGNQGSNTIQAMTIDATGIPKLAGSAITFTKPELTLIATLPAASAAARLLGKDEVRPMLKALMQTLQPCFARATGSGVVNPQIAIDSDAKRTSIEVLGFDTTRPVPAELERCVRTTIEHAALPPIGRGGHISFTYPLTFGPGPVDNHDTSSVDLASRESAAGRWVEALAAARKGLELVSLDGTYRRRLIEMAGIAACRLKDAKAARGYYALASRGAEKAIAEVCRKVGIDPRR